MTQQQAEILWREEKYNVMFHSQKHYTIIRQAMREQQPYEEIKQLITEALTHSPTAGSMQNACQHMWGYFKKLSTAEERAHYTTLIEQQDFQQLLHLLKQLAEQYNVTYLLESRVLTSL